VKENNALKKLFGSINQMEEIHLAIDAMGGDYAPEEVVTGAVQGAREHNIHISLVGDPTVIQNELSKLNTDGISYEIIDAPEVIQMDESPVKAVRARPDATINVACRMVAQGKADGVLTMGHSGAGLIAGMLNFGLIPGIERPAFIVPFLGLRDGLFITDAGANTEVRPNQLVQFAQMGTAYVELVGGIKNPTVGLLSNGSEPNKGNKLGRTTYPLLSKAEGIDFYGNIEGHTMLESDVNIILCDGFTGNVVLKIAEGIIDRIIKQAQSDTPDLVGEFSEVVFEYLKNLRWSKSYANQGVAALLGLQFPIFIGHGRSKAIAIRNGMAHARRTISEDVLGAIRERMVNKAQDDQV
jgi:glycerol-3-phosphate acyltransferase PlsX